MALGLNPRRWQLKEETNGDGTPVNVGGPPTSTSSERASSADAGGGEGRLHLLVEFWDPRGPVGADALRALLLANPGVLSVRVEVRVAAGVGQAAVVMAGDPAATPAGVAARLRAAGYWARVSRVPGPEEDSAYARYYHADPDSVNGRWVD